MKVMNWVAFVSFMLGACALDSDSFVPLLMVIGGIAWLVVFYLVNAGTLEDKQ